MFVRKVISLQRWPNEIILGNNVFSRDGHTLLMECQQSVSVWSLVREIMRYLLESQHGVDISPAQAILGPRKMVSMPLPSF